MKNPTIFINGVDVAPYLYGSSSRILIQTKGVRMGSIFFQLKRQLQAIDFSASLFGVRLKIIDRKSIGEVSVGTRLLALTVNHGGRTIEKRWHKITGIEKSKGICRTKVFFPDYLEGLEGRISVDSLIDVNRYAPHSTLYLLYYYFGSDGMAPKAKKQTFYDKMVEMALDLKILAECWRKVCMPETTGRNYISDDPEIADWLNGFERRHGALFSHRQVWSQIYYLLYTGKLEGINTIYNDNPKYGLPVDLITPLITQMVAEILSEMMKNPELVDLISNDMDTYRLKRLRSLLMGRGTEVLKVLELFALKKSRPSLSETAKRQLSTIIELIRRPSTPANEKEAALRAYERLTGQKYAPGVAS